MPKTNFICNCECTTFIILDNKIRCSQCNQLYLFKRNFPMPRVFNVIRNTYMEKKNTEPEPLLKY